MAIASTTGTTVFNWFAVTDGKRYLQERGGRYEPTDEKHRATVWLLPRATALARDRAGWYVVAASEVANESGGNLIGAEDPGQEYGSDVGCEGCNLVLDDCVCETTDGWPPSWADCDTCVRPVRAALRHRACDIVSPASQDERS